LDNPREQEENMKRQTVEYTFEGEKLSFVPSEHGDLTLCRTPEDTYFVHLDAQYILQPTCSAHRLLSSKLLQGHL
jgi:hypothetical protein